MENLMSMSGQHCQRWELFPVGDVVDRHNYPELMFPFEDQFNDYEGSGEFASWTCRPRSPMGFRNAELGV